MVPARRTAAILPHPRVPSASRFRLRASSPGPDSGHNVMAAAILLISLISAPRSTAPRARAAAARCGQAGSPPLPSASRSIARHTRLGAPLPLPPCPPPCAPPKRWRAAPWPPGPSTRAIHGTAFDAPVVRDRARHTAPGLGGARFARPHISRSGLTRAWTHPPRPPRPPTSRAVRSSPGASPAHLSARPNPRARRGTADTPRRPTFRSDRPLSAASRRTPSAPRPVRPSGPLLCAGPQSRWRSTAPPHVVFGPDDSAYPPPANPVGARSAPAPASTPAVCRAHPDAHVASRPPSGANGHRPPAATKPAIDATTPRSPTAPPAPGGPARIARHYRPPPSYPPCAAAGPLPSTLAPSRTQARTRPWVDRPRLTDAATRERGRRRVPTHPSAAPASRARPATEPRHPPRATGCAAADLRPGHTFWIAITLWRDLRYLASVRPPLPPTATGTQEPPLRARAATTTLERRTGTPPRRPRPRRNARSPCHPHPTASPPRVSRYPRFPTWRLHRPRPRSPRRPSTHRTYPRPPRNRTASPREGARPSTRPCPVRRPSPGPTPSRRAA